MHCGQEMKKDVLIDFCSLSTWSAHLTVCGVEGYVVIETLELKNSGWIICLNGGRLSSCLYDDLVNYGGY